MIPPHLKRVAVLPCEILKTENSVPYMLGTFLLKYKLARAEVRQAVCRSDSANFNWTHIVAELSVYKDSEMLSRLAFPVHVFAQRKHLAQFILVSSSNRYYF